MKWIVIILIAANCSWVYECQDKNYDDDSNNYIPMDDSNYDTASLDSSEDWQDAKDAETPAIALPQVD
jgi:hypothetical protein